MRLLTFSIPFLTLMVLSSSFIDHALNTKWASDQQNSVLPEASEIYNSMSHVRNQQRGQALASGKKAAENAIEKANNKKVRGKEKQSAKENQKGAFCCGEDERLF